MSQNSGQYDQLPFNLKGHHKTAYRGVGGIRAALVQNKSGGKVVVVVEEIDAKQARSFSLLDLGKFMDN